MPVSSSLCLSRFEISCLPAGPDVLAEEDFEQGAHQRLDEEQLGEEREGKVEAHQLEPVGQQGGGVEAVVVRIVQKGGDQAHGRAHQPDGGADDGAFKNDRVGLAGIEVFHGQFQNRGFP